LQNFDEELINAARAAAQNAYAPYSKYQVGAAIKTNQSTIFSGSNVENISYGATICAERAAVCSMVTAGESVIHSVAVSTKDGGTPCGICLQVLFEFSPRPDETQILLVTSDSVREVFLSELAPAMFSSSLVGRTN